MTLMNSIHLQNLSIALQGCVTSKFRGIFSPRVILTAPRELEVVDGNLQVVPLPEPVEVVEEPILEE